MDSFIYGVGLLSCALCAAAGLLFGAYFLYQNLDYALREHWLPWVKRQFRAIPISNFLKEYDGKTLHRIGHTFTGGWVPYNIGFWITFWEKQPSSREEAQ